MVRCFARFFLAVTIVALVGCGDGGTAVQPTQAIVKVQTSGTPPAGMAIGGLIATVTYPTTKGLSIATVGPSGAGTGSFFVPNISTAGQVRLGLLNATGVQPGEFATLTFSIASGNPQLVAGDYAVADGASVVSTGGQPMPDITATIASVVIQ